MLGATIILVFQNLTPVAIYFFGSQISLVLPITVWILLFIAAGFFTSLFWQFLYSLQRPKSRKSVYVREPEPDSFKSPPKQTTTSDRPSEEEPMRSPQTSDWEIPNTSNNEDEDWNIEKPPVEPTNVGGFERKIEEKEYFRDFEVQQEPKTASRSGSVYSYKYRDSTEPKEKEANTTEKVYDANYRVINPPYTQKPDDQFPEDEEDWI
jgi:hypothetical protein